MKIKPTYALLTALVVTSLFAGIAGVVMKYTVCKAAGQLQDDMPVSIPFTIIGDDTIFHAVFGKTGEEDSAGLPEQPDSILGIKVPEEPEPNPPSADANAPAPVFHTVDETYFDDALFIGDSRTVGLSQYGRLGKADYFASTGMTVFNVLKESVSDNGFSKQDLPSLLSAKKYGKIYLMLGINEIGYPFESLLAQYEMVLQKIKEYQPDAVIVLCANLNVTREKAEQKPSLSTENIGKLNEGIAGLSNGNDVFYLDANEIFCKEDGYLKEEVTGDGVHPYGTGYEEWAKWLCEKGI